MTGKIHSDFWNFLKKTELYNLCTVQNVRCVFYFAPCIFIKYMIELIYINFYKIVGGQ